MECRQCQSGYVVSIVPGARYCGFCGAGVNEITVCFQIGNRFPASCDEESPLYLDTENGDPQRLTLEIRVENKGTMPAGITGLKLIEPEA
ncbi:MAG: hypothetical protein QMD09_05530 [Desulfatibacillaceae bacterium]|nr:hypothetical protein [Desulfatibacillaceae bacterium]